MNSVYTKITYYHTLYKKDVTDIVHGSINFQHIGEHSCVLFYSGGHGYMVDTKYIKKIEPLED